MIILSQNPASKQQKFSKIMEFLDIKYGTCRQFDNLLNILITI